MIALLLLLMQTQGWTAAPYQPTVGDTIRLERSVSAPPGWRLRAGKLASTPDAEPLGDAEVLATPRPGDWIVRYTVVAWTPGSIALEMPSVWRLGPDGSADSLAGGSATFRVASVIPDSVKSPAPQPSLAPLRRERLSAIPVLASVLVAAGALLGLIAWRRRSPRDVEDGPALAGGGEISDVRWLSAGEPKAVAARAAHGLRSALAHSIPAAHEGLSTAECLAVVERVRPDAPVRDLRELLTALDQVAFAAAHGVDVAPLAARARALAREFGGRSNGGGKGGGRSAMTFARPWLLLLLAALPLWWWWRARRLTRLAGAPMSDVRPALGPTERLWIARLPVSLRSLCLAAWIIAAAGPRVGSARAELRSEGISIVLAVDISSSMLAEDFSPANRLDVARRTAIEFVRARSSDRIGLVAFSGQALTQVPITTDYQVLEEAIRQLRVGILEDGTAIGTAIATSANRLRRTPGKSKVIVLLTDGMNNRGTVDPRTAAQAAATFGIKIYTIAVGQQGEAPVPTGQGPLGLRYETMPVEIDEPLLDEIARTTGGRYFRATDAASLSNIFGEINRLEKTPVQHLVYRRYEEAYRWPLSLGLLALALELVVAGTFAVRVP